jgi:CTP:molybdopterin cytidylyltransferase MocA
MIEAGAAVSERARGPIALAVLAAGGSRRLGTPKQLVPYRGRPLLRTVVLAACSAPVTRVAVVLGARAPEIAPCLCGLEIDVLVNADWQAGMATSVRCATAWARARGAAAVLLVTGDQPRLDAVHLRALVEAHRVSGGPVASFYDGVRGVPALFPRASFPRLLELRGDKGAAALLRGAAAVAEVPWPAGAVDVDEPSDLAALAEG